MDMQRVIDAIRFLFAWGLLTLSQVADWAVELEQDDREGQP